MLTSLRRSPVLLVLAAIALFAVGGAAFTAANTTDESSAGTDVSTAISGFTITNIVYTLDGTDPTVIDQVTFTADSAATAGWPAALTTSVARFTNVATEWFVCADDGNGIVNSGVWVITCVTDGVATFYDASLGVQLTVLLAVEFDTVLVQ